MRFDLFTPHQFQESSPYYDSLLLSTHSPFPLDIALPFASAELISQMVSNRVLERFAGRMTHANIGSLPIGRDVLDAGYIENIARGIHPNTRVIVVLVDRLLLGDCSIHTGDAVSIIAVDWWQWLRKRVPQQRFLDALMYLTYTHPMYYQSHERTRLGIQEPTSQEMHKEGQALLGTMVDWICARIVDIWTTNSTSGEGSEDSEGSGGSDGSLSEG